MSREITIDPYDRDGVFVAMIESAGQGPIALETEGGDSSFDAARKRAERAFAGSTLRWCICRLVPVQGNELLPLDMKRMQK